MTTLTTWALILAGGDGTRLATLTRDEHGHSVPKQFCSLAGDRALVDDALQRARHIAPRERTCIVVAERHRVYWKKALRTLDEPNIIEQPRNCGTAIGILLAVLCIFKRDPLARIVFLPADHFVRDEAALAASLSQAVALTASNSSGLVLIGIEPEGIDPDLGYIIPGEPTGSGARRVARFVEKPDPRQTRELLDLGAVWNSFIFAVTGATLLGLLLQRIPHIVNEMWLALARDARPGVGRQALQKLYETLPSVDFSSAVLQGSESSLRLLTAAACGWTDLGTPSRVASALRELDGIPALQHPLQPTTVPGVLNLAVQYRLLAAGDERPAMMA